MFTYFDKIYRFYKLKKSILMKGFAAFKYL